MLSRSWREVSIDLSGTEHFVSLFPAALVATHLALPNRVLGSGPYTVLFRSPSGLPCAAILVCDMDRSAAFPRRTGLCL